MIIRRQLYPENKMPMQKTHYNGMEVEPIYKSNSASAGTAVKRDVDYLLKPIQRTQYDEEINGRQNQFSKERTERNLWRNEEVMEMLYTMQQVKALEKLNDKTVKSEHVFKDVEVIMHRNGFAKKSHVQIWTKWKFLKSTYMTSKRNGVIPRIVPPKIYDMIHQMITGLNQSLADSASSVDGDSCNDLLISGTEEDVSDVGVANEGDEDSFGMAHPIFGFRLGMVKSEPEDTGYEPVESNDSDKDTSHEKSSKAKSVEEVKEEPIKHEAKCNKDPSPIPKVVEVPHRGRGRPPKNPPAAAAIRNNTSSQAGMPPLRVAPFAKALHNTESNTASRPPPPLTMPPTSRIRVSNVSNLKNGEQPKFAQPKLIPKPMHHQHSPPVQLTRVAKEGSAQTRSSSTPSPSYPKMKQIPMRKTPYSLRPDRAIPDLDASLSPPPSPVEKLANKKLEEVPTTKHLVMQSAPNNFQNIYNRNRRTDDWQQAGPAKRAKLSIVSDEETNACNNGYDKNYSNLLQNVIIDLSSSLRKMQTEMMRDFFNKQNELLEREHKFQMQQDHMIMKAFQEQTQEIMHSVKQLVGSIKTSKDNETNPRNDNDRNIEGTKPNRLRRMQKIHAQEREDEMAEKRLETDNCNDGENEMEDVDEDTKEEQQETDDEQQDQIDRDDNEHDEIEDNASDEENEEQHIDHDQSQSIEEQNENGLAAEE